MKKTFSARRVPRKVGGDEDEASTVGTGTSEGSEPTIKRPTVKPRKSSNFRASIGISVADDDEDEGGSGVVTPKRNNLSKAAIQRHASKRASLLASSLPTRQSEDEDDRPSYSAASLRELKDSTPSTPRDLTTMNTDDEANLQDATQGTQALDLSSKFGSSLARYQQQAQSSTIPSAGEIAEKKARRARLAKEQAAEEYISLDPDDPNLDEDEDGDPNVTRDERGMLVLKPKDKYGMEESRLVRDDEDIMENFDDFTEDGKMHLGRKAEAEAAKRRKADMAAQIAQAEGEVSDDSDSDASEKERNAAFEAAQTRHGTFASNSTSNDPYEHLRPKTPVTISALPTLDGVLERMRRQLNEMQTGRMRKLQEMEALQREKVRLLEEEVRIQKALRETAEKFQGLRREKGIVASSSEAAGGVEAPGDLLTGSSEVVAEMEDGEADGDGADAEVGEDEDGNVEADGVGHTGLGFGGGMAGAASSGWLGAAPGLGMGAGSGMSTRPPSDDDDY